eukprot:scaffold59447_cov12-Tisochrysis_lutea.AAC.1
MIGFTFVQDVGCSSCLTVAAKRDQQQQGKIHNSGNRTWGTFSELKVESAQLIQKTSVFEKEFMKEVEERI